MAVKNRYRPDRIVQRYHAKYVEKVLDIIHLLRGSEEPGSVNSAAANRCFGTPVPKGVGPVDPVVVTPLFPDLHSGDLDRILQLYAFYAGAQRSRATKARKKEASEAADYVFSLSFNDATLHPEEKVAFYGVHITGLQDTAEQVQRQEIAYRQAKKVDPLEDAHRELAELEAANLTVDAEERFEVLINRIEKLVTSVSVVDKWSPETRIDELELAIADLDVIYDDLHRALSLDFLEAPSHDIAEEITGDAGRELNAMQSDDQPVANPKLFADLNRTMYSETAAPQSFKYCVDRLRLDVKTDLAELNPISTQDFSIAFHGLGLKPWQPQGNVPSVQHIDAPYKYALCCDDVGLGKTVMTLAAVVQHAHELEDKRQAWADRKPTWVTKYRHAALNDIWRVLLSRLFSNVGRKSIESSHAKSFTDNLFFGCSPNPHDNLEAGVGRQDRYGAFKASQRRLFTSAVFAIPIVVIAAIGLTSKYKSHPGERSDREMNQQDA
ncbi:hypothetical protein BST61_g11234 [Cercospora zeina]